MSAVTRDAEKSTDKKKQSLERPKPSNSAAPSSNTESRDVSGLDERDERARSSGRVPSNNSPVLAVPQLGLRDNLIRCELLKNEDLYTYREHFSFFLGTYNVNGQTPKESLRPWLSCTPDPPDMYCVGFQELDLSKEAFFFNDTPKEMEWTKAVSDAVHPDAKYALVKLVRLVGIMLLFYVKKEHAEFISDVEAESVGTGIMGRMGNKGAVGLRFRFHNSDICVRWLPSKCNFLPVDVELNQRPADFTMNILPKKSWHVRNKDNVARVRRDEAQAAAEEREAKRRVERAEQEARTEFLRRKARAALQSEAGGSQEVKDEEPGGALEHLNLFPIEESVEKKDNEEYLKEKKEETEKQERAIGLLVSLGPQPGTEVTPWYMKTGQEKEKEEEEKKKKEKEKPGEKRKELTEEEREKKDRRLKDSLDPLREMKKALGQTPTKSKKKDKRDRGEKRSRGESSIERLRAERFQREAEERRRAQELLAQRNGKDKESRREVNERDRPYNSAYFPELARKRQRRDRDSWRDEILKL